MRHLKTFEAWYEDTEPEYGADWKVGDIIVGNIQMYTDNTDWIIPGERYEILGFNHNNTSVKIRNIKNNRVYVSSWLKTNFITEENWELQQQQNKYNL
jgi:hypothetical protein